MFDDNWLYTYYQTNFDIMYKHKFLTNEQIDNLMPFERDIYIDMLTEHLKQKQKEKKLNNG